MKRRDLRGTWFQALRAFFGPVVVVLGIRWLLVEPFVIPSGSMIPTLLIHDHIIVNKLSFGIHVPFGHEFLVKWGKPKPGDIVVFRYPENPDVFYVKRVVAVGGDEIAVHQGEISINGKAWPQTPLQNPLPKAAREDSAAGSSEDSEGFSYFEETSTRPYVVRYLQKSHSEFQAFQVPADSFFVMGDNRDQSNDSRFWGTVPEANLVGKAQWIWLSCEETLASAQFLCNPSTIRWDRLLKKIK